MCWLYHLQIASCERSLSGTLYYPLYHIPTLPPWNSKAGSRDSSLAGRQITLHWVKAACHKLTAAEVKAFKTGPPLPLLLCPCWYFWPAVTPSCRQPVLWQGKLIWLLQQFLVSSRGTLVEYSFWINWRSNKAPLFMPLLLVHETNNCSHFRFTESLFCSPQRIYSEAFSTA